MDNYIDIVFEKNDSIQKDIIVNSVKPYETVISESAIERQKKHINVKEN